MLQKKFVEANEKHILLSIFFFENRAVCEIMWKNIVERGRSHMTTWRMRIACWIPEAKNTNPAYAALTTTIAARTLVSVMLCRHSLSYFTVIYSSKCKNSVASIATRVHN
jgi:hypothetical protein